MTGIVDLPLDEWLRAELGDAYGAETEAWAIERVARVTERLHAVRVGRVKLETQILWIPEVTAFTAPGRFIYLSRRLLERCASDEPVAFVLAHEMAHHDLGHLELFDGWRARLPRVGGSRVIAAAFRLLERRMYGPEHECDADAEALRLCVAAGYEGARCVQLFDILESHALDLGDLDGVFGRESSLDPSAGGVDHWVQRAQDWTWERMRGYMPIRERRARLDERLRQEREQPITISELGPGDCDAVTRLWRSTDGIVLRDVDERVPLLAYLSRNRGLSFVARRAGTVVGAVLCGTDGRRGYLQHLAVAPSARRRGVGRALVERSIGALREQGIHKCHLMVLPSNEAAIAFWRKLGWHARDDVVLMSSGQPDNR